MHRINCKLDAQNKLSFTTTLTNKYIYLYLGNQI